ncbi:MULTISPECIES: hypothetical protein [Helicobacter]|uniref:Uncharacterized protein n=1 Tax=Helicobacter typhlonius TaxID=76936 RepID=A0A0S4PRV0_9HELI|nr:MULTISPECIES: hypothetical protein [Helicobacter]CUU39059.1 Hypothetical protein BN2458_PEG0172 [Helicobacter typhlonius]
MTDKFYKIGSVGIHSSCNQVYLNLNHNTLFNFVMFELIFETWLTLRIFA